MTDAQAPQNGSNREEGQQSLADISERVTDLAAQLSSAVQAALDRASALMVQGCHDEALEFLRSLEDDLRPLAVIEQIEAAHLQALQDADYNDGDVPTLVRDPGAGLILESGGKSLDDPTQVLVSDEIVEGKLIDEEDEPTDIRDPSAVLAESSLPDEDDEPTEVRKVPSTPAAAAAPAAPAEPAVAAGPAAPPEPAVAAEPAAPSEPAVAAEPAAPPKPAIGPESALAARLRVLSSRIKQTREEKQEAGTVEKDEPGPKPEAEAAAREPDKPAEPAAKVGEEPKAEVEAGIVPETGPAAAPTPSMAEAGEKAEAVPKDPLPEIDITLDSEPVEVAAELTDDFETLPDEGSSQWQSAKIVDFTGLAAGPLIKPRPRWRRLAVVGVVGAGMLFGVVMIVVSLFGDSAKKKRAEAEPDSSAGTSERLTDMSREPARPESLPVMKGQPRSVRLTLDVGPADARPVVTFQGRQYHGSRFESPPVPPSKDTVIVTASAKGYKPTEVRLVLDRDLTRRVELKPVEPPVMAARPAPMRPGVVATRAPRRWRRAPRRASRQRRRPRRAPPAMRRPPMTMLFSLD